ncbi:MAG: FxsA family protein [Sandaracinaceae bacterium]
MLLRLFVLFTAVPLLEVYLLFVLGQALGLWPTVALVLLTGVVGATLARREGTRVWRRWQGALARGEVPEGGLAEGLLVLVGGVLLVTPGVLTDLVGLGLLVPPIRGAVARRLQRSIERRIEEGSASVHYRVDLGDGRVREVRSMGRRGSVIETEGEVVEEERPVEAERELGRGSAEEPGAPPSGDRAARR